MTNAPNLPLKLTVERYHKDDDPVQGLKLSAVPAMKLVEIIRTSQTSDDTYAALREVTLQMKKAPVTCKDTPGFIVNRLLVPYMRESSFFSRQPAWMFQSRGGRPRG